MGESVLEVVLGAIVAILLTIWIETKRKARLSMSIAPPHDNRYQGAPASKARFLAVEVQNQPLPRIAKWMSRNAALQCHGSITFHDLEGRKAFTRAMPIRWSGSIEPLATDLVVNDTRVSIFDHEKYALSTRVDIYPGESRRLDVAARFDDEPVCYGWSNENYFSTPIWRAPGWRLPAGVYLVRVEVVSAGEKCHALFRLINDVPQQEFRLEQAPSSDSAQI